MKYHPVYSSYGACTAKLFIINRCSN